MENNLDENITITITYKDLEFTIDKLGYFKDKNGNSLYLIDPQIVALFKDKRGKISGKRFMNQKLKDFINRLTTAYELKKEFENYDNTLNKDIPSKPFNN
jgi:hypothetical protein